MNYQELPNWVDVYKYLDLTDIFSQKRVCKATLHASLKYLEVCCPPTHKFHIQDLLFTADIIQKLPDNSWNQLYNEATRVKSIKFNCTGKVSTRNKTWLAKIIKRNYRTLKHIEIWTDEPIKEVEDVLRTRDFHALALLSVDHFDAENIIATMKNCTLAIYPPSPSAEGSREPVPIKIFIEHLGVLTYEVGQQLGQMIETYPFQVRIRHLILPKDHQWLGFPNAWMRPTIKNLMIHLAPHLELVDKMPLLALLQSTAQGQAFKLMIDSGANVDSADDDGWTAMHWAARDNMVGSADVLYKHNADINAVSLAGYTPMIVGAYRQNYDIVEWLIDHKATVDQVDQDGDTALLVCASKGLHFEPLVTRLFEELGADATIVNNKGQSVLTYAGFFGMAQAIRILVTKGNADPSIVDKEGHSPLILAIKRSGDSEPAKAAALELLALGADVNYQSLPQKLTALSVATSVGGVEIAQELLNHGADVNAADDEGDTPLMVAVKMRMPVLIHMFLNHGANPNVVNVYNETPLDMALYNKEGGIAVDLIRAGSHLNTQDKDGDSPLMIAISMAMVDTAHKILDKGPDVVDVGIVNKRGDTALILAAFKRLEEICMRILLEYGPDDAAVYEEDEQGDTAMLVATSRGLPKVALYMLKELNIHPGYMNRDGRSVITEAVHRRHWEVALLSLKRINAHQDDMDAKKLLQTCGLSLLRKSIFYGNSAFAEELLENSHIGCSRMPLPKTVHSRSKQSSSSESVLVNAAYQGMAKVVELLCQKLPPGHLEVSTFPNNHLIEKERQENGVEGPPSLTPLRAALSNNHSMTAITLLEAGASSTGLDAATDDSPVLRWLRSAAFDAKQAQDEGMPKAGLAKISTYLSPVGPLITRKILELSEQPSARADITFGDRSSPIDAEFSWQQQQQSPSPLFTPMSTTSPFQRDPIASPVGKEVPDYLWSNVSKTAALFEGDNFQRNAPPRSLPPWLIQSAKQRAINERELPIQSDSNHLEMASPTSASPNLLAPPVTQRAVQMDADDDEADAVSPSVSIPLPPSWNLQEYLQQHRTAPGMKTETPSGHLRTTSTGSSSLGERRPRPHALRLSVSSSFFRLCQKSQEEESPSDVSNEEDEDNDGSLVTVQRREAGGGSSGSSNDVNEGSRRSRVTMDELKNEIDTMSMRLLGQLISGEGAQQEECRHEGDEDDEHHATPYISPVTSPAAQAAAHAALLNNNHNLSLLQLNPVSEQQQQQQGHQLEQHQQEEQGQQRGDDKDEDTDGEVEGGILEQPMWEFSRSSSAKALLP